MIEIKNDSKLVKLLAAQARYEKVDSDQAERASKLIADLAADPNPYNKYQIAQLIAFTVNEMVKPTTDWLTQVADTKYVGYGEKAAFKIKQDGIRAFIQARGATTARSKVSNKQVTLDTIAVSARPVINNYELKTGRVQMADLIRDAAQEMSNKEMQYIQSVLDTASSSWATPFYGTGSGIVKATLNPMIQHWMRTGAVSVLGDIAIISKLAEQTGFTAATATMQFSPNIIDEFMRTGLIGTYYGAKVVNLVNPYQDDNVTPVINEKKLFILPSAASADMRPLKVVFEGDVQFIDSTNIDDLSYEVRLDQFFGAGVVIGKTPCMSVYTDSAT